MYVCVLFTYTISISIICVFYRTNLVLKHPSNIYTTFTAPWVWSVCFDVCLCVISNQSTSKKPHYVSGHSKLDTLLHKTHIQVPVVLRYQGLTCVDPLLSLSKIAHQMWRDHPFSQRNITTEGAVGVGVGGDREVGGINKIGALAPLFQLCKETLKFPILPNIKLTSPLPGSSPFLVNISHYPITAIFERSHPLLWRGRGVRTMRYTVILLDS